MTHSLKKSQAGLGLIEVLIVLVIMGVGLLALAKLQIANNQLSSAALLNTQATLHIEEMIERLRSNKTSAINGDYNTSLTDVSVISQGASLASSERYNWAKNLQKSVPQPQIAIQCNKKGLCLVAVKYAGPKGSKEQVLVAQL